MTDKNEIQELKETALKIVAKEIAVPLYQDVMQPSAKKIGEGLETVTSVALLALEPLKGMVWGYDKIKELISIKLTHKLETLAPEDIQTPKPSIAVPTIEALRYTAEEEELNELFLNLLASSMNRTEASKALPCFVEIIKQLTADEAKIMTIFKIKFAVPYLEVRAAENEKSNFWNEEISKYTHLGSEIGCDNLTILNSYLDNLARLGLLEINNTIFLQDKDYYNDLKNDTYIKRIIDEIKKRKDYNFPSIQEGVIRLTDLGKLFTNVCIRDAQPIIVKAKTAE